MKNKDFQIGKCYKTLGEIPSIPFGSNVILLEIKNDRGFLTVKLLYVSSLRIFNTFLSLEHWLG